MKYGLKGQQTVHYELYVDVLFGNCLIMNYWIVSLAGIVLRRSATRRRRAAAAAVGALLTVLCLLIPGLPAPVYLAVGYGMTQVFVLRIAFHITWSEEMMLGCVCMCFLSFLYGGFLSFLQDRISWLGQNGFVMPALAGAGAALCELLSVFVKRGRKKTRLRLVSESRRYEVRFRIGERAFCCTGLLDTGNRLYDPIRGMPAAVLAAEVIPQEERGMPKAVLPYHSLGCQHGILYAYAAKDVSIIPIGEQEKEAVYLKEMLVGLYEGRLSVKNDYQILLHPDFFFTESKKEDEKRGSNYDFQSGNTDETTNAPSA